MVRQAPLAQHLLQPNNDSIHCSNDGTVWAMAGTVLGLMTCMLMARADVPTRIVSMAVTKHALRQQPGISHLSTINYLSLPSAAAGRTHHVRSPTPAGSHIPLSLKYALKSEVDASSVPLSGRISMVISAASAAFTVLWRAATRQRRGWYGPGNLSMAIGTPLEAPAPAAMAMFSCAAEDGYVWPYPRVWNAALST